MGPSEVLKLKIKTQLRYPGPAVKRVIAEDCIPDCRTQYCLTVTAGNKVRVEKMGKFTWKARFFYPKREARWQMAHKDNVLWGTEAMWCMWPPPGLACFPLSAGGAIQAQQEEAERSWHNIKTLLEPQDWPFMRSKDPSSSASSSPGSPLLCTVPQSETLSSLNLKKKSI